MEIKDLNIEDILPIVIDNILINTDLSLTLSDNTVGEQITYWKQNRGGIFLKDLKKNKNSKYVEIIEDKQHTIGKILNDEELTEFSHLKIHQINDINYIIIKNSFDEENPNALLIDEFDDEDVINQDSVALPLEDEEVLKQKNIELFN